MLRQKILECREVRGRYIPREVCVVRVTTYSGMMRRGATWRTERTDETLSALDQCAHAPVTYSAPVRRRRHHG